MKIKEMKVGEVFASQVDGHLLFVKVVSVFANATIVDSICLDLATEKYGKTLNHREHGCVFVIINPEVWDKARKLLTKYKNGVNELMNM